MSLIRFLDYIFLCVCISELVVFGWMWVVVLGWQWLWIVPLIGL